MGMSDCSTHHVPSTGRCYTCHKPYCNQCNPQNGCCSAQCAAGRQRFAGLGNKPRKDPFMGKVIRGVVLLAIVLVAIRYKRQIMELLGF